MSNKKDEVTLPETLHRHARQVPYEELADLKAIAERGGYHLRPSPDGKWLTWTSRTRADNPDLFQKLFPEDSTFIHRPGPSAVRSRGSSMPAVSFLMSNSGPDAIYPPIPEALPNESSAELRTCIADSGERMKGVLERIQCVLKVWVAEAERCIIGGRNVQQLKGEKHREAALSLRTAQECARHYLWKPIARGMPTKKIEEVFFPRMQMDALPKAFTEAQQRGVRYWLSERDQVIRETMPFYRRWVFIERRGRLMMQGESESEMHQRFAAAVSKAILGTPVTNETEGFPDGTLESARMKQDSETGEHVIVWNEPRDPTNAPPAEEDVAHRQTIKIRDAYLDRCQQVENGEKKPFKYKKDLQKMALRKFGYSHSDTARKLKETRVWITVKSGKPGAGLAETLANLEAYPDHLD